MADYLFIDLEPEIAAEVPGVNAPALIRCARKAARYFCDKTSFVQETAAGLDIVIDQPTYTIPAPASGRSIVRAREVWVIDGSDPSGERQLLQRSADQLDRESMAPREHQPWTVGYGGLTYNNIDQPWRVTREYPPTYYFQEQPNTVRLVGIPDQGVTGGLKIVYVTQPGIAATGVDTSVVDQWLEEIVLGTRAYLLQMGQKAWTDIARGRLLEKDFEGAVEEVQRELRGGLAANDHVVGHVRAYP